MSTHRPAAGYSVADGCVGATAHADQVSSSRALTIRAGLPAGLSGSVGVSIHGTSPQRRGSYSLAHERSSRTSIARSFARAQSSCVCVAMLGIFVFLSRADMARDGNGYCGVMT